MRVIQQIGIVLLFALAGAGCATQALAFGKGRAASIIDSVTESSVMDGDATSIIEGCGWQPIVGFTYCRQAEGDAADKSLWFVGPPAKCGRDACVYFKVWNNQGQLVWGGSLAKGKTRIEVPWKTILARDTFELMSRGFWTVNTVVYWTDPDGRERESTSQGDIVLRVHKAAYVPLHTVADDPNYLWTWTEGKRIYKVTSGLRAYVGLVK